MTEYIKKKRGRKPKNKLPDNVVSNVVTNDNKSEDETYTKLIADLREALKVLSQKIEPKVYEYGFLKE